MTRLTLRYAVNDATSNDIRPLTGGGPVRFSINGVLFPTTLVASNVIEQGAALMLTLDVDDGLGATADGEPSLRMPRSCSRCGDPAPRGEWHTCKPVGTSTSAIHAETLRHARRLLATKYQEWGFNGEPDPPEIRETTDDTVLVAFSVPVIAGAHTATLTGVATYRKVFDGEGSTRAISSMAIVSITAEVLPNHRP